MNKKFKKIIFLLSVLFFVSLSIDVFAQNKLLFQEQIAPGVIRYKYNIDRKGKDAQANVIKVDLNNPYIKINTVAGAGTYTNKATVTQMANRTNAVALVNGDFFAMNLQGAPQGGSIINGEMKSSPGVYTDIYTFGIDENNNAHIEIVNFNGTLTAPNGKSYPIDGLNKTYYWHQPSLEFSHESKIQIYDSFWTSKSRGYNKNGEVLLSKDNVVEKIQYGKNLNMSVPKDKKILQISGAAENFFKNNVKVGDKVSIRTNLTPNRNWKMMIGGHALLVENGAVKKYTKDISALAGVRARTAIGIKNNKEVYIVSVEGRTNRSAGIQLGELSQFMLDLGCKTAMNLDGGGSSAMSVRNLGDINRTRVTNPERNQGERKVVNGLGVYNTTKNTGIIADGKVEGNFNTIVGETSEIKLSKAWDEFLNPINLKNRNYTISDNSDGKNIIYNRSYTPMQAGKYTITLNTDKNEKLYREVNVSDASNYTNIEIKPSTKFIKNGSNIKLKIKGNFNGRDINISPKIADISFENIKANINPNDYSINILSYSDNPSINVKIGNNIYKINLYDENSKLIKMKINDLNYTVNGENKKMDAKPFIANSRTLVPIRFIVEALGGEVNWDNENRIVKVNYNGNTIELPIGSKTININGNDVIIDQEALIKNDRTFVPIRFVAENLDMIVNYIHESREIEIVSKVDNINNTKVEESIEINENSADNTVKNKNENSSSNTNNNLNKNVNSTESNVK